MTKKIRNKTLASIITAVYILATMTACSNGVNSDNLSSDTVTTTHTDIQTPSPETTTTPVPETEQKNEAAEEEKKTETSVITSDTPAPETEQSVPETEQTTTSQTEAETPAPETTTTVQTTTPQTEAQVTTPVTTVTTTPAPEWDESKVSGTKYVNTACYSRKKAVLGSQTVKLYNVNDKVTVVAKTNTGYYKLDDGTFIHSDYLSDSKVVITTTTVQTTTPKPQETPAPETEKPQEQPKQEIVTLYSQHSKTLDGQSNKFYSDVECTKYAGGTDWRNFVIEAIKINDDVYQIVADTPETAHRNGKYVKASDFSPVKAYMNPIYENYDIEGMKQRLIEIGTKEYGLVYKPAFERLDGTTWGPPDTINADMLPGQLEDCIETRLSIDTVYRHLDPGDTFAIYIEKDEYNPKYACTKEEFEAKQYYTIYVIDGGRSIVEQ